LERATELDAYLALHKKPFGPLHGLPVSLKDAFRVSGVETSIGYVGWLGKPETEETQSGVVNLLQRSGAVFYVKTNIPTSLMVSITSNDPGLLMLANNVAAVVSSQARPIITSWGTHGTRKIDFCLPVARQGVSV
jgi:Asp-tRNA(Asn)/Glu-tRNA(Gln) amidotransferase A subunit family amidase